MKTYLHGTDYESALSIMANGFSTAEPTVWTCSDPDLLYVRDSKADGAEFFTVESGQIAAAYKDSKSTKIGIIKITMTEELAEELVAEDDSCPNMDGCYQIDIDELNRHLSDGSVSVRADIRKDAYIPYFRAFYLAPLCLDYLQINDPLLLTAMNIINQSQVFMEEIYDYGDTECTVG